ncbi:MAG: hypothetical protein OHK0029_18900 [Armatimonadaceae bacterium]
MRRTLFPFVLAAFAVALSSVSARADLKIVTQMKVTGAPEAAQGQVPPTTTTFIKGDRVRVEQGKTITITDYKSNVIVTLDPVKKTYSEMNLNALTDAAKNPMMAMFKMDVKADVKPTGKTKELLGRTVKEYKYSATVSMSVDPNAGEDTPLPPGIADMLPTVMISGENWVSDTIQFPIDPNKLMSQSMQGMLSMFGAGMKDFQEKMAAIPGYPLETRTLVEVVFPPTAPKEMIGETPGPVTTTTTVTSISEEPLPDSLFDIPADYEKVTGPALPIPGADNDGPR